MPMTVAVAQRWLQYECDGKIVQQKIDALMTHEDVFSFGLEFLFFFAIFRLFIWQWYLVVISDWNSVA